MKEVWKDIEGYEEYYQVSNLGRVKSLDRTYEIHRGKQKYNCSLKGQILKPFKQRQGYLLVDLRSKTLMVHRLVAHAFIPNPKNKPEVNHKDGVNYNNCAENLEWVTPSENVRHSIKIGKHFIATGEKHGRAIISDEIAYQIKNYPQRKHINKFLAEKFSVSPNLVREIRHNRSWKHIKKETNE